MKSYRKVGATHRLSGGIGGMDGTFVLRRLIIFDSSRKLTYLFRHSVQTWILFCAGIL
jgi:hypothetical protein